MTAAILILPAAVSQAAMAQAPSVLVITVDALRADRMSAYGYQRPTTPHLDELLASGVRFERAHTVEPLTAPALTSLMTGISPEDHGTTRNGVRMESGLDSLPKLLNQRGWRTAGFVGNWTLKDKLTGLGDHFDHYESLLSRRRWFGLFNGEATGEDLTDAALDWIRSARGRNGAPFFLWVHYVEPHAPYRYHGEDGRRLKIHKGASKSNRYDTEVSAVDREIGQLLAGVREVVPAGDLLVVFSADHGESLGEHDYWGHGRHLYEPALRIPMGVIWPGHVKPRVSDAPALITDLAPTTLGLLGFDRPPGFTGRDWSEALRTGDAGAADRLICVQAHKGAVKVNHQSERARSQGLLEVGVLQGHMKELYRIGPQRVAVYDLTADPGEQRDLAPAKAEASHDLQICVGTILDGLGRADELGVRVLDEESVEQLKSLGYLE